MTSVTEPSSTGEPTKTTTIAYDSAERVGTITRPDSTTETFLADQEQGFRPSSSSGSPGASVLLAEAATVYTNPLLNATYYRPDWRGMGLTNQIDRCAGQRLDRGSRRQRPGDDHDRSAQPDHAASVRQQGERHQDYVSRPEHRSIRNLQQLCRAGVDDRPAWPDRPTTRTTPTATGPSFRTR